MSRSYVSNQSDRILKISEKLNSINIGVENERFQKLEIAEARLRAIEEQFEEVQDNFFGRLSGLKDNIHQIQKIIEEESSNREQILEQKTRDILAVENKFVNSIEAETQARKESEQKIIKALEDKVSLLRQDISREGSVRNDQFEQIHQSLEIEIPRINETIKNQSLERQESDQMVYKRIQDDLQRVNQYLSQEKKSREESEEAIFEMLRDIVNRVKLELDTEKKQREDTEENLLALLEDTCNKLSVAASF